MGAGLGRYEPESSCYANLAANQAPLSSGRLFCVKECFSFLAQCPGIPDWLKVGFATALDGIGLFQGKFKLFKLFCVVVCFFACQMLYCTTSGVMPLAC